MTPKLPASLAKAVGDQPDEPLRTEGESGGVFYVMTDQSLRQIIDDNTRSALRQGLDAILNGDVAELDTDDIKCRAGNEWPERANGSN